MHGDPRVRAVFELDRHQAANALQQALEMRSAGRPADALAATTIGIAAEMLAEALLGSGYVIGVPTIGDN